MAMQTAKYVAISLLFCVGTAAQSPSDKEMKLREIYNQHAKMSASFGNARKSLAEQQCADIHATAAEEILAHPSKASLWAKQAKTSCDDFLKLARDEDAKAAHIASVESCLKIKQITFKYLPVDSSLAVQCRAVGVELSQPTIPKERVDALTNECKPFVGKPYAEWPKRCAEVSSGLREYLNSTGK